MNNRLLPALLSILVLSVVSAQARVKLVALPERARVTVSLTNPNATLVEEERILTLQRGVNRVDFSWRGVNIDATSIQVRLLGYSQPLAWSQEDGGLRVVLPPDLPPTPAISLAITPQPQWTGPAEDGQ